MRSGDPTNSPPALCFGLILKWSVHAMHLYHQSYLAMIFNRISISKPAIRFTTPRKSLQRCLPRQAMAVLSVPQPPTSVCLPQEHPGGDVLLTGCYSQDGCHDGRQYAPLQLFVASWDGQLTYV